jgi:cobalt-zinc-cadmium efflux system outer membrane protein
MSRTLLALAIAAAAPPVSALAQGSGDPAPLTIAAAVDRARSQSPFRAGAAALADGAAIAARLAGRQPNPLVDLRVENLGAPGQTFAPDRDVFAVVTQPLELGGKPALRRSIARTDVSITTMLVNVIERQIALDTVRTYMRAVRARDVLETLTLQRDGVETLVATMRRRVDEGYAPESDLLRFDAEAARMSTEVARTTIELSRALTDLAAQIGSASAVVPAQLVAPAPLAPPMLDEAALARAVTSRADVQLAMARVDRARAAADLERRRRFPDPSVSAGYKRTQGQNTAVAGVLFSVPMFDRNGPARALADAAASAAESERAAAELRATTEARASLMAARALAESAARVQQGLLAPAEGGRNAARAMFREGATDVLKLVDAERIYADVRREALAIGIDAYVAAIEARFAVGQEDIP